MRFTISLLLLTSACSPRRVALDPPRLAYQASGYVVVQTSPDRFLILTKSHMTIEKIQKDLGCGKPYICSGQWNGEMWTIERLK